MTNLKEQREAKGYSLSKLAYMAGVSTDTIRRIEQGLSQPKPDTIRYITEALEL